ncbi:tungstate/molybdate transport system permease protein [Desulfacinum infernum DSM 9756]|jgi:molybdate/tungstate transport system permease protein|uniref:Tungstate/molybdate transport system permease protein n=1 Tax=Desulfacinum infernum DSM 9756 TaxID=1121391 RepID=A0A1M4Y050_9BACT|nr:ABC transporter permease [Desulfacinum infernum]MBC7359262.1 ABC transporter permease [Desulfacinum sp.]SHE98862.1 tungstate/molybdate transport system permease protein [Desulfacinum infernum DSM 9756]
MRYKGPFHHLTLCCGGLVLAFILLPLWELMTSSPPAALARTLKDGEVVRAIRLSLLASGASAAIAFILGTPLAYLLARFDFRGKRWLEAIVDLPVVIPHPVVGIAVLGVAGRDHALGRILLQAGVRILGSVTGIIVVLTFVGLPFYINTVRDGFEAVSPRLENVSRSLGASMAETFLRITLPLSWRSVVAGLIMSSARAISEFGAVVIVAYHPMTAPVLIYERFEGYGLRYSQPVAVWLVGVCLVLFAALRALTLRQRKEE